MSVILIAAGKAEEVFGAEEEARMNAFAASRAPNKIVARLYGGPLHGETVWTPPEPVICVYKSSRDFISQIYTYGLYTYGLALSGRELEEWAREYGHYPYQI